MASIEQPAPAGSGTGYGSDEMRRAAEVKRQQNARRKQALELQRENILSQRTSNAGRRTALEAALAQIEAQIQELG